LSCPILTAEVPWTAQNVICRRRKHALPRKPSLHVAHVVHDPSQSLNHVHVGTAFNVYIINRAPIRTLPCFIFVLVLLLSTFHSSILLLRWPFTIISRRAGMSPTGTLSPSPRSPSPPSTQLAGRILVYINLRPRPRKAIKAHCYVSLFLCLCVRVRLACLALSLTSSLSYTHCDFLSPGLELSGSRSQLSFLLSFLISNSSTWTMLQWAG